MKHIVHHTWHILSAYNLLISINIFSTHGTSQLNEWINTEWMNQVIGQI